MYIYVHKMYKKCTFMYIFPFFHMGVTSTRNRKMYINVHVLYILLTKMYIYVHFFQFVQVSCFSTPTKPYMTALQVARDLKITTGLKNNYFSTP